MQHMQHEIIHFRYPNIIFEMKKKISNTLRIAFT